MDMMISNMDEMRQLMLARVQATKTFYATLTPEQQRAFDAMGAQGGGGM
jgi:Spy/CpxP family protein refolding chaperone